MCGKVQIWVAIFVLKIYGVCRLFLSVKFATFLLAFLARGINYNSIINRSLVFPAMISLLVITIDSQVPGLNMPGIEKLLSVPAVLFYKITESK